MNSKILCVAEKPSVAKEVARILNNNQQPASRRGPSPYNPIWEVRGINVGNINNATLIITSVTGHLMELEFDNGINKNWSGIDPVKLLELNSTVANKRIAKGKEEKN